MHAPTAGPATRWPVFGEVARRFKEIAAPLRWRNRPAREACSTCVPASS